MSKSLITITWRQGLPLSVATLVLLCGYLRHNQGFAVDDSYITFRYAQNALAGHGFVFNVGQHYYGSTAAGYAMLLAGIVKLLGTVGILVDVPQVSTFLSAVAVAAMAWISGRACLWSGSLVNQACAVLVAMFVAVLPLSSAVSAHETYAFTAALAVGSYLVVMRRALFAATMLFVVAMTLRPDSLLFVLLQYAGLAFVLWLSPSTSPYTVRRLLLAVAILLAGMLAWIVSMKLYYGTFVPGTMDAKKAQVQMGYWPLFKPSTVATALDKLFAGRYWLLLLLPAVYCLYVFLRSATPAGKARFLISSQLLFTAVWALFAVGVVCAYMVFHVALWTWYVVPIGFSLLLSAAYGVNWLSSRGSAPGAGGVRNGMPWVAAVVVFILAVGLSLNPRIDAQARHYLTGKNVNGHLTSYDPIVWYLKKYEPDGTSVAIAEPGTFGYKLGPDYQVLDVLGLASPGVAKALRQGDFDYTVRTWEPKYVVTSWQGRYNPDQQPRFGEKYELVGEFTEPYWDVVLKHGAMLYRRKAPAASN